MNNKIKIDKGATKQNYVVQLIEEYIREGIYKKGDILPSVNKLGEELEISRLTVMSAYRILKTKGVITSAPGKGYFVSSERTELQHRIFLLFDELNGFKEDLYNSFIAHMGDESFVDIYFHHFNKEHFKRLILESIGKYTAYVVMPVNFVGISDVLNKIPNGRLYILDQISEEIPNNIPAVYQDFECDIYNGLAQIKERLKRYEMLVLSHYDHYRKPIGILKGFKKFCEDYGFNYIVENSIKTRKIKKGEVYILTEDRNLIHILLGAQGAGLVPGKDIGIIMYNETDLRKVTGNGITTISTDFKKMGESLAWMIKKHRRDRILNPSSIILRSSL